MDLSRHSITGEGIALWSRAAWEPERLVCGIFVGTTPTPTCPILPGGERPPDRPDDPLVGGPPLLVPVFPWARLRTAR